MKQSLIESVLDVALQAGRATLAYHPGRGKATASVLDMQLRQKPDMTPVTQADMVANRIIVNGLAVAAPDIPVVSEELNDSEKIRQTARRFWLVDPLDGTKEFVKGGDDFTVNIALVENGFPIWGVVYAPSLDCLYWGGEKYGSMMCIGGAEQVLSTRHLDQEIAGTRLRVVASKNHLNAETMDFIHRLGPDVEFVQAGSSLKFFMVARGLADLYPRLGDTSEWDTAAAQAVLEGAGGVVCDLQGHRLKYGKSNVLNPYFLAARSFPSKFLEILRARKV